MDISKEAKIFEDATGIMLPEVLLNAYRTHGAGGFGPDYGVLGIISGHQTDLGDTMLGLYQSFCSPDPEDKGWKWPRNLVPFIHLGCAIHLCFDSSKQGFPVIRFDPTGYGPGGNLVLFLHREGESLKAWLDANGIG